MGGGGEAGGHVTRSGFGGDRLYCQCTGSNEGHGSWEGGAVSEHVTYFGGGQGAHRALCLNDTPCYQNWSGAWVPRSAAEIGTSGWERAHKVLINMSLPPRSS